MTPDFLTRCGWARRRIATFLVLALAACATSADQRDDFLAAESALTRHDRATFDMLTFTLRDYPLYPYLRFEALKRDLAPTATRDVESFLVEHGDSPLSDRLRRAWLERLAERGEWHDYARLYRPDESTERRCHYLRALLSIGRTPDALPQVAPLWLTGRSLPDACNPVLDAWRAAGGLTQDLVWGRIALAVGENQVGLARYLGRFLPTGERPSLDLWLEVHVRPDRIIELDWLSVPQTQLREILMHGVERLAGKSPQRAAEALNRLTSDYGVPAPFAEQAAAAVGLALARDGDGRGMAHLDRIQAREDNLDLQERRLRAALGLQMWRRVASWVDAMPAGERKSEHWIYWQARALELLGEHEQARILFREAAGERSLWGFLAAERMGLAYRLDHRPTPVSEERIARVEASIPWRRIAELRALGRTLDARRELYHLTRDSTPEDLQAAAVLAKRGDWPDQAIFTLAKSGYWDDLELRFPLLHRGAVHEQSNATGLDAAWIYAILRQESAFNTRAASHAGALGLMQLMPETARSVALSANRPRPSRSDLFDPVTSIGLGSRYLADMQHRFDNHPALAAAADNAGPHRVARWLPAQAMDADLWVATIPYAETRGYVRRVLAYRVIYDHRLGRPIRPLSILMPPILPVSPSRSPESPEA